MAMARPAHGAAGPAPGRDGMREPGMMPPPSMGNALQLLHVHLLFNEEEGIEVGSALSSIRDRLDTSPRRALGEALRVGLVRKGRDAMGRAMILRGPRSDEVLRRIYDGEPPTMEALLAWSRAWEEFLKARDARLEAIRESARPTGRNTAHSLPAWMP